MKHGSWVGAPPATIPRAEAPEFRPARVGSYRRASTGALAAWAGFAGVILSGALLALSAARTGVLLPESMRLGVPTTWRVRSGTAASTSGSGG